MPHPFLTPEVRDRLIKEFLDSGDFIKAQEVENAYAKEHNLPISEVRDVRAMHDPSFNLYNPSPQALESANYLRTQGTNIYGFDIPPWTGGPLDAAKMKDALDTGILLDSSHAPHYHRLLPYTYGETGPFNRQNQSGLNNFLFQTPQSQPASFADAMRHKLTEMMQAQPLPYTGQQFPEFGDFHKQGKQAAVKRLGTVSDLSNPFIDSAQKRLTSFGESNEEAFKRGQHPITAEDLAKHIEARGLNQHYVEEAAARAATVFDQDIAPKIAAPYARFGRGFDSSSKHSEINHARQRFVQDAIRNAEAQYTQMRQHEVDASENFLQKERDAHMSAAERQQAARVSKSAELGQLQNIWQGGHENTANAQRKAMAEVLGFENAEKERERQSMALARQEHEKAQQHYQNNINTLANVANNQPVLPAPAIPAMPVSSSPFSVVGSTFANLAGTTDNQGKTNPSGFASGGAVHLPHDYTDEQLGMNHPDINRARELAESAAQRPNRSNGAYWSTLAKAFDQRGGYGAAIGDAHSAARQEENNLYNSKLVSSQVMQKIHDARLNQRKALMQYDATKEKNLWDRAHHAQQLAVMEKGMDFKKAFEERQWEKLGLDREKYDLDSQKYQNKHSDTLSKDVIKDAPKRLQTMDRALELVNKIKAAQQFVNSGKLITAATSDPRLLALAPGVGPQNAIEILDTSSQELARLMDQYNGVGTGGSRSQELAIKAKGIGPGLTKDANMKNLESIQKFLEKQKNITHKVVSSTAAGEKPAEVYSRLMNDYDEGDKSAPPQNPYAFVNDLSPQEVNEMLSEMES